MRVVSAAQSAGSAIGDIFNPLFVAIAGLLTFFYSIVPSYGGAIILLTIAVMVILAPLTFKATRSMVAMQRLAPEMKKLQAKYKDDRQRLNEELMALYRENNVSPFGTCLPLILQIPGLFVLYNVIRGLSNIAIVTVGHHTHQVLAPKYISHTSQLYHNIISAKGQLMWLGMDLSKSATKVGGFGARLPFYLLIVVAIGLSYLQMHQMNKRNPQASSANPQMMRMQKILPIFFGLIYINLPAAIALYFAVSSAFRLAQQELQFRFDPVVVGHMAQGPLSARSRELKGRGAAGGTQARRGLWAALSRGTAAASDPGGGGAGDEIG